MSAMSKSVPIGELHVTVQRLLPAQIAGIDSDHIRREMASNAVFISCII